MQRIEELSADVFNAIFKDRWMTATQADKARVRVMKIINSILSEHRIALADAQLIGYRSGKWDNDIVPLAEAMGLTKSEWKKLKKNYSITIDDEDKLALNKYFKEQKTAEC